MRQSGYAAERTKSNIELAALPQLDKITPNATTERSCIYGLSRETA